MKQKEDDLTTDIHDVFLWPDGWWCFRYELNEVSNRSNDYKIIYFGSNESEEFFERLVGS